MARDGFEDFWMKRVWLLSCCKRNVESMHQTSASALWQIRCLTHITVLDDGSKEFYEAPDSLMTCPFYKMCLGTCVAAYKYVSGKSCISHDSNLGMWYSPLLVVFCIWISPEACCLPMPSFCYSSVGSIAHTQHVATAQIKEDTWVEFDSSRRFPRKATSSVRPLGTYVWTFPLYICRGPTYYVLESRLYRAPEISSSLLRR